MKQSIFSCILALIFGCNAPSDQKTINPEPVGPRPNIELEDEAKDGAIALVIGQNEYQEIPKLKFPESDADSIAEALKKFGMKVIHQNNVTKDQFKDLLEEWAEQLPKFNVGLLFYSGHGVEWNGINFLIPTDLPNDIRMDIRQEAISLDTVLTIMEKARTKMNLVFLDACRDNPFATKSIFGGGGLREQYIPTGTFIGFAASPGRVSYDIGISNSIYTEGILKNIRYADMTIDQVFNNVNAYVRDASGGRQIPYKHSSLDADFYFTISTNSSDTRLVNQEDKSRHSSRIRSLFPPIPFGSSVEDVLAYEFGEEFRNSFTFDQLPVSSECTNNEIRYYWRKLSETTQYDALKSFLESRGLDDLITDQSSIFYTFKDRRLFRLAINLNFSNVRLHKRLLSSLGITDDRYRAKFFDYHETFYTVMGLDNTYNLTSIFFGEGDSYTYCNNDWFSSSDTLNAKISRASKL